VTSSTVSRPRAAQASRTGHALSPRERDNRRLLRARDAIDRDYGRPLDVPTLARIAHVSPSHFSRSFKATFGETPHRYLQRRRIERAMALLRDTATPVTDAALIVGFSSLGTFSRTFRDVVGVSPSEYRRRTPPVAAPVCFTKSWMRPAG
jgi:AraC-like DNA-binding protein